jgi:4-amino-4-deoxy-L-arabinose transferase-like glycosyltransferase
LTSLRRRILAAIVLGALTVRVGFVLTREDRYYFPDSLQYAGIAKNLLARGDLSYDDDHRACRGPGYPVFLAGCFALFGESRPAVRLVQAVIGAATCLIVFALARVLFGEAAGLLAAAFTALYPFFVFYAALELSETLFITALAGAVLLMQLVERGRWWLVAAGVAAGITILIRPSALLLMPVLGAAWALRRPVRRHAFEAVVVVLIAWACVVPWTWRNYRVFGHFVPMTLTTGESLYEANSPYATGGPAMDIIPWHAEAKRLTEYERDRYYQRLATDWIRANPGGFLRLAAVKIGRFWNVVPNDVKHRSRPLMAISVLGYVPVMLLAVGGMVVFRRRWRELALLLAPAAYFSVLHAVFVGSIRYREPVMPFLIVLAGVGAAAMLSWLRVVKSPRGR